MGSSLQLEEPSTINLHRLIGALLIGLIPHSREKRATDLYGLEYEIFAS